MFNKYLTSYLGLKVNQFLITNYTTHDLLFGIMLTTNVLLTSDISNIDNYPIVFKNIVWENYLLSIPN